MKVILKQDIKGTGSKDQIIEVSDGYARNFLFPRKLAIEASAQNLNAIRTAEAAKKHKKDLEREEAVELAAKLKELTVKVYVKAGDKGRLFGSVTTQEIADALKAQHGLDIDKRKISLADPIKQVGPATADVKLYSEVSAPLSLQVEAR